MSSARQTVVLLPSLMPLGNLPSRMPAHHAERLMGMMASFRQDRAGQFHGEHPWSFWDAQD